MLLGGATVLGSSALPRDAAAGPTAAGSGHLAAGDLRAASQPAAASTNATTPSMQVSVAPSDICAQNYSACSAGTSSARVALQVAGPAGGAGANWTSIDLLFLLETTPYDGAFDQAAGDTGADSCAAVTGLLCEESSLLLTFATNAGRIATSLAAAHPGVEINFGLVDYFATLTSFDDGDGDQYHVDVGNFTPASAFGTAVNNSLLNASHPVLTRPAMTIGDSDLSDNFLATDSISAMYLALFGGGLNWSNESHHVLVQLGSSAPQDPNYPENYCISPSDYRAFSSTCLGSTCEPSVTYGTLTSPACVGWVLGPANNTNASIANYARTSPECANSTGALCTIDAIDVWDTPHRPEQQGMANGLARWRTGRGKHDIGFRQHSPSRLRHRDRDARKLGRTDLLLLQRDLGNPQLYGPNVRRHVALVRDHQRKPRGRHDWDPGRPRRDPHAPARHRPGRAPGPRAELHREL